MSVMNPVHVFKVSSMLHGMERITAFLEDHFICAGWSGIGDLENVNREEMANRLALVYKSQGQELVDQLNELEVFVHAMKDGDYVLVAHNENVHLGDVGDYYYVESFDTPGDGTCHRRGVTWLNSIPRVKLNAAVQALLRHPDPIKQFEQPFSESQLARWGSNAIDDEPSGDRPIRVDRETVEEALNILKQALRSDDADRRERAAIAILQYSKGDFVQY